MKTFSRAIPPVPRERWKGGLPSASTLPTCDPVDLDLSNVAVGQVRDDASCTDISGAFTECQDGSSCQNSADGLGTRNCKLDWMITMPFQGAGERCLPPLGCGSGLRCAPRCGEAVEGVCSERLAIGDECRFDLDCASVACLPSPDIDPDEDRGRCAEHGTLEEGERCIWPADCTAHVCVDGACAAQTEVGHGCTVDEQCAEGTCLGFACAAAGGARPVGEACDGHALCASGACVQDVCAERACKARLDPTGHGSFWQQVPLLTL